MSVIAVKEAPLSPLFVKSDIGRSLNALRSVGGSCDDFQANYYDQKMYTHKFKGIAFNLIDFLVESETFGLCRL